MSDAGSKLLPYDQCLDGNPYEYASSADASLGFSVAVPTGMLVYPEDDAQLPEGGAPGLLAALKAQQDNGVSISLCVVRLAMEAHPLDWLDGFIMNLSISAVDFSIQKTDYGVLADMLGRATKPGEMHTYRFATVKDGNRLFLLEGHSDGSSAGGTEFMQRAFNTVLTTFQLTQGNKQRFAEPFGWVKSTGRLPLAFVAPSSWTQEEAANDAPPGGALWQLNPPEPRMGSLIIVGSPAPNQSEALAATSFAKMQANGITVDGSKIPFMPLKNTAMATQLGVGDAVKQGGALQIICAKAEADRFSAFAAMISPAREADFESWAGNRRVFELVAETMGVMA